MANERKSIRLKGYNYATSGAYFLTICTKDKEDYFNRYEQLKHIVEEVWIELPQLVRGITIDEFIVMPNHIHGIIMIENIRAAAGAAPTVGNIVGTYKSLCVNRWWKFIELNSLNISCKFWQRSYYDRIIRSDNELQKIRQYIQNNPVMGWNDNDHP